MPGVPNFGGVRKNREPFRSRYINSNLFDNKKTKKNTIQHSPTNQQRTHVDDSYDFSDPA